MRSTFVAAAFAALTLGLLGAEGPSGSAPAKPAPPAAGALSEAPADRQESLRDRRLHVSVTLKDGKAVAGVLESYTPGKDGLPGTFVLTVEGGKPVAIYDLNVVRLEVVKVEAAEPAKEPAPPHSRLLPELMEAMRAGTVPAFIARHEAALKKVADIQDGRAELWALAAAYRHQQPEADRKQLRERLRAGVDGVEDALVRADLHRLLQEERILQGRPLRPLGGRGLGPGGVREPEKN